MTRVKLTREEALALTGAQLERATMAQLQAAGRALGIMYASNWNSTYRRYAQSCIRARQDAIRQGIR